MYIYYIITISKTIPLWLLQELSDGDDVKCDELTEFKCQIENSCIEKSWVCDGTDDCLGNEDEASCPCKTENDFKLAKLFLVLLVIILLKLSIIVS